MTKDLAALTEEMITIAKRAGADAADALAIDETSVSLSVRGGALESAERSELLDIGLRVFVGQRQACVASSNASPSTLQQMAERAVAMATEAPEDPHIGLADAAQLATDLDAARLALFDPADEPEPAQLQDDVLQVEAAALAVDGVSQVQGASAGYSGRNVHLAASNGFSAGYKRTYAAMSCQAISGAGTDMQREFDYDSRVFLSDMRAPADIGRTAGERAVAMADARKPATGTFPVIYDERVASSLIGHLVSAVSGSAIARGSSWLRDAMGQPVLPDGMSLFETPHRPRSTMSTLFDGEGLPTAERAIVRDGVLQSWTLDLKTARKLGLQSTANAMRQTSSTPSPGLTTAALTQGDKTKQELLRDMGTGLLITSMIGSTINPNTGDYSRGASGFWIENGEIAYPVNECTVAGNLRDMLRRIIPANDARSHVRFVVPSLLVEGLTIAGD